MDTKPKHPLTSFRAARKWTLDQLANEIGVKRNTVWRWENGRMPRPKDWPRIEAATGISPSQLAAFSNAAATASEAA